MELTINKKTYELKFNIRFLHELDDRIGMVTNDMPMGMGMTKAIMGIEAGDPLTYIEVANAAIEGIKPNQDELMETLLSDEKLTTELEEELKKSVAYKFAQAKMK